MDKLEKLSKIIRKDTVSKTDVKDFLALILTFAKENKQNLDSLSKEYLQTIQETLQYIETNNQDYLSKVENESTNSKTEVKAQLKELKSLIKKAKAIKPVKGKDADEELIVDKVLEKIVLPEFKETVLDNGEQIVDKINALSLDEENKIDASHIKNLPEIKGGKFYGGSGTIKEIIAGDNVTVDNSNLGYPIINATGANKGGVVFNFYRSTGLLEEDGFKAVVPYSGTITGWAISTKDGTPQTITLNVKKAPFDDINNFTAIDGSEPIILSSAINNSDTSLSTWTTTVNAGDHIEVTVESVSGTVIGVYGIINITKTS